LELIHLLEDLDLADVVKGLSPIGLVEFTGCEDDEVSAILWKELISLLIIEVDQLVTEILADYFLVDQEFVLADVWDLQEHRCGHVHAVKCLQVDGKVRWHLELSLFLLEWLVLPLTITLKVQLCQAVFEPWGLALDQDVVGLVKESQSEVSQSNLNNRPVVVDLVDDGLPMNNL
jgi:hypothetical protein